MLSIKLTKGRCAAAAFAFLMVALPLFAGCAPTANEGEPTGQNAQGDGSPAVQVAWTPDADCSICHTEEGSSLDLIACTVGENGNQACTTCHADEPSLTSVHEGATTADKMPKKLKSTEVSAETCESCHGSVDDLAAKTSASTVLTDARGTVANPHSLPENGDHESLACADCHQMHESEGVAKSAPKACSSCHHAGVYECNTCHEAH